MILRLSLENETDHVIIDSDTKDSKGNKKFDNIPEILRRFRLGSSQRFSEIDPKGLRGFGTHYRSGKTGAWKEDPSATVTYFYFKMDPHTIDRPISYSPINPDLESRSKIITESNGDSKETVVVVPRFLRIGYYDNPTKGYQELGVSIGSKQHIEDRTFKIGLEEKFIPLYQNSFEAIKMFLTEHEDEHSRGD